MADFPSLVKKWDPKFACFFLQKFMDSKLLLNENTAVGAVEQLKNVSKYFVEEAINPNINYQLSSIDEELLEQQWLKIISYENSKLLPSSVLSLSKSITELKTCLVNIGTYIMFKSDRRFSDLEFAVNILSLTLGTVRACLQDELIEEAVRLLKLASQSIRPRMNDETVYDFDATPTLELAEKFELCCSSLFVYHVLALYRQNQYNEMLMLLGSIKEQNSVKFGIDQTAALSRICFGVGHGMFYRGEFEGAIVWLKFAHSFGKPILCEHIQDDFEDDSLTLLAACYMQIDMTEHWHKIIEILDYSDDTTANLELRLQTLLVRGKDIHLVEQSVRKYLALKYREGGGNISVKTAADQLFGLIEKQTNLPFLMQILSSIPWRGNQTTDKDDSKNDWSYVESIKWICAKYAAHYFMAEEQTDKLFELLCELQHWNDENVDDELIRGILCITEGVALRLINEEGNVEACLRWYEVIVQFANRHGIDSMVTWNAISCLLQLPHETGYQRAVKLSAMIPEYDSWVDQDLLCIRLQMALRGQEYDKAQQIIADFETGNECNDWNKIQKAISRSASIARDNGLFDQMLNFLENAVQVCKTVFLKAILLRFVLRFQIELLHKQEDNKESVLTNILSTIATAYSTTLEARTDDHFLVEIRTWFARTSWNLGRIGNKESAYFRHHLFKLSSQFFALEPCWMKEMKNAMVKAIEAAFDFGPNRKRISYVRILESALDVVNDFYQHAKGFEYVQLIQLMEIHALCDLAKDWPKVEKLCQNYIEDRDVKLKHDADFFVSLASILISTKDAKICEAVTNECIDDTFERKKLSAHQQIRLTSLAASSLEKAIDLSMSSGTLPSLKIIILHCRWMVGVLFNSSTVRELSTLKEHVLLLDKLAPWLRSTDIPFSEIYWIFKKIWNCTLLCPDQNFKREIARWLRESFKQSPHYPKLMDLFQQQFDYVSPLKP
ncbi:hypothetical protein GHT06_015771 [Daphnia sinensis]|uniref:Protein ZIP4 homolog n=1 Tax=Daphnia sinensis TaxID=1820382 RepID=A0AAD5KTV9_9CRUS|nr:hypothetical protein GHT06_015771 [Daphnia sinensis]